MNTNSNSAINGQTLIGGILEAFGYAQSEQVAAAFTWQQAEREAGRDPGFLGEILVSRGVCDAPQRDFAMQVQTALRNAYKANGELIDLDSKSLIGKILVALGYSTNEKVEDAFAWQKAERDAGRQPGFLGEILVARGACTAEQRDFAMAVQNALRRV